MAIVSAKSELFSGNYLLHFHTVATDGELSVEDYFEYAHARHIDRLIWLEHIRRDPTYDVAGLVARIRRLSGETGTPSVIGFEAKVLPGGSLDISDEHLLLAEVVGMAEHGFRGDENRLEHAITAAIDHYRGFRDNGGTMIWVHPGSWFRKNGLLEREHERYLRLLRRAEENGVRLERNSRYKLLSEEDLKLVRPESVVYGADAHSWNDLARHEATFLAPGTPVLSPYESHRLTR